MAATMVERNSAISVRAAWSMSAKVVAKGIRWLPDPPRQTLLEAVMP